MLFGGFRSQPRPFCLSVLPAEPSCSSFCRTCLAVSLPRVTREPHAARDAAQRVGAEAAASPCACSRCLKPCSWHASGAVGRSWRRISARRPRGGGRQHLGRGASGGRQATSGRTSAGGPVSSTPWMPSLLAKPPPLSLFFPLQPLAGACCSTDPRWQGQTGEDSPGGRGGGAVWSDMRGR